MRAGGLEPPRPCSHRLLRPACLPFHHARAGKAAAGDLTAHDDCMLLVVAARDAVAKEGVVVIHPNRSRPEVRAARSAVVFLLLLSAAIIALVTATGWSVLEGAGPLEIGYIVLYLLLAYLVLRWNRGALPTAGTLAVFLIVFAAIAAPGWFEHEKQGYTQPSLNADLLGVLTLALIPLQILLVVLTLRGFQQGWNVEVERPLDEPAHGERSILRVAGDRRS